MRLLFEMDRKDYDPSGSRFERPSVRGIIVRDGKVAMVHSKKFDYYKFPGGGIEPGEEQEATLIREVKEESGLVVIPATMPTGRRPWRSPRRPGLCRWRPISPTGRRRPGR